MAQAAGLRDFRMPVRPWARAIRGGLCGLLLSLSLFGPSRFSSAHDWFGDYTTGREEFESCCGDNDCRTAESLGNPRIVRRDDGGYNVKIGPYWLRYDFPAVYPSHDSNIWVCYLDGYRGAPDPLCLFLPPGIV